MEITTALRLHCLPILHPHLLKLYINHLECCTLCPKSGTSSLSPGAYPNQFWLLTFKFQASESKATYKVMAHLPLQNSMTADGLLPASCSAMVARASCSCGNDMETQFTDSVLSDVCCAPLGATFLPEIAPALACLCRYHLKLPCYIRLVWTINVTHAAHLSSAPLLCGLHLCTILHPQLKILCADL